MPFLDLLYIYDATIDWAEERSDADITIAHKGTFKELVEKLLGLVDNGFCFRRGVITTHGYPGYLEFAEKDTVNAAGLTTRCAGRGLHLLFPMQGSRLYFNGCEVGAEPGGRDFVTTAAKIFLRTSGGTAYAMTSNGYRSLLHFIYPGHVFHYGGSVISTRVGPGGVVIPDGALYHWDDPPSYRDHIGNKF